MDRLTGTGTATGRRSSNQGGPNAQPCSGKLAGVVTWTTRGMAHPSCDELHEVGVGCASVGWQISRAKRISRQRTRNGGTAEMYRGSRRGR